MSQVRNILTNRMINRENARFSNEMVGHIHINSAQQVICNVVLDVSRRYDSIAKEYDWVSNDYARLDCIKLNIITKNNYGRIHTLTSFAVPSIDLSAFNSFNLDGEIVYTNLSVDGDNIPSELMKEASIIEYRSDSGSDAVLPYKQWIAMSNRPSARPVSQRRLYYAGSEMLCEYTINQHGWLSSRLTERRMEVGTAGVDQRLIIENDSDSYRAYQQWSNDRFVSRRNSGSIFGYHQSGSFRTQYDAQMENGKWYFGIEAEKQDSLARGYAQYLGGECGQWGAERDSSLGSGGVEFISPILPLHNGSLVRKNFQQHRWMLDAKLDDNRNASRTACGGHMTISKKGMSGSDLLTHLHHFVPLFYSLYIGRLNTNYGGAVAKSDVSRSRRAFNLKPFGVEIRIFSGVPSMEGAWWRVQLLQVIANMIDSGEVQSYKDVANALVTDKHPLRKVMRKQYDSKRIRDKFALVLAFGHMYENNGSSTIDISGTSDDVKHKSDRVVTAFNQFRDVRSCTHRLWGVSSITTTEG